MSNHAQGIHPFLVPFLNRFLHWFTVGIGTTVMSLLMLSKGSTVQTLGVIVSVYSVCIVLFEFPTGVLSDIIGQKRIYLFSVSLSILAYAIVLFTNGLAWLFLGFAFYGIARAFSSGSVEALFISQYLQKNGKETLHKFMSILNTGEILGIALGALLGGLLPMAWDRYFPAQNRFSGNLVLQIIVLVALFLLTVFLVKDPHEKTTGSNSLVNHVRESLGIVVKSKNLILLIAGTLVWGFCFNAIELYWQPQVRSILGGESQTWIFGVINSGYFLAALAGVGIITLVLGKKFNRPNWVLFIGRAVMGLLIVILSFQTGIALFTSTYLLLFMVNGMMNIPEGTLLNALIPDDKRSSLLSLASLMLQLGSIIGSLVYSLLVGSIHIPGVWILAGAVFGVSSLIYLFIRTDEPQAETAR